MEEMFREDQLQKTKEIAELSKEIQALKVTLIGIDGSNGLRSQLKTLSEDMTEVKKVLNENFTALRAIQSQENQFVHIFATKEELKESDSKLYRRINELSDKINVGVEQRRKERKEQEKYIQNLKNSRIMMTISVIGLLLTMIINFFM